MSTSREDTSQQTNPETTADHQAYERQLEEALKHEREYVDRLYGRLDELLSLIHI